MFRMWKNKSSKHRTRKGSRLYMKKRNKTKKRTINIFIINFIFLLSVSLLCYGLFLYGIGIHNIDLGHNIRIVNAEHNLNYQDINNQFEVWDSTTMYINGFNQINKLLYLCIMGALSFGFFFSFFQVRQGGR